MPTIDESAHVEQPRRPATNVARGVDFGAHEPEGDSLVSPNYLHQLHTAMPRRVEPLSVMPAEARQLHAWVRAGTTPQRVATRARIVLLAAEGMSTRGITHRLGVNARTVMLWRQRYRDHGAQSLWRDAPGRGRKPTIDARTIAHVCHVYSTRPPDGRRWTIRRLANVTGLSRASVHRILARCIHL